MRRTRTAVWAVIGVTVVLAHAGEVRAVVNGAPVTEAGFQADFGWAVALEHTESGGMCTAQLISPSWVLGAAHCASTRHRLLLGNRSRSLARQVPIAEVIAHPQFDPPSGEYDIALIRLAERVSLAPLQVATPSDVDTLLQPGAKAVIAGWGKRSSSTGFSDQLVVSDVELRQLSRNGTRFAYVDPVSGPCGGDSGGPLLRRRPDGVQVLLGVASRTGGNLCATGGGVGVYVDVSRVRDFIIAHVKDLPPDR